MCVMLAVGIGEPVAKVFVVIFNVGVMHLQPNARNVDRVHMRRKPPVRLVNIVANVGRAVDDVAATVACLLQIRLVTETSKFDVD